MSRRLARVLLVEGQDDMRVVPYLVEGTGISWGAKSDPIVRIVPYNGIEEILKDGEIETHLKTSGLRSLGVIVDADESTQNRWLAIRARIEHRYTDAPRDLPSEGVILRDGDGVGFGAWIMPDNVNRGMLETFLLHLRPQDNQPLLDLSQSTIEEAHKRGATFRENHRDKAMIHAWLAWQDPPGRQLHNAIMERMLTHGPDCLNAFVAWFCGLYEISR